MLFHNKINFVFAIYNAFISYPYERVYPNHQNSSNQAKQIAVSNAKFVRSAKSTKKKHKENFFSKDTVKLRVDKIRLRKNKVVIIAKSNSIHFFLAHSFACYCEIKFSVAEFSSQNGVCDCHDWIVFSRLLSSRQGL